MNIVGMIAVPVLERWISATMGAMTGDELRRLRWSLGFRQRDFAKLLGVQRHALSCQERGVLPVHDQIALLIQLLTAKSPSPSPTANAS